MLDIQATSYIFPALDFESVFSLRNLWIIRTIDCFLVGHWFLPFSVDRAKIYRYRYMYVFDKFHSETFHSNTGLGNFYIISSVLHLYLLSPKWKKSLFSRTPEISEYHVMTLALFHLMFIAISEQKLYHYYK